MPSQCWELLWTSIDPNEIRFLCSFPFKDLFVEYRGWPRNIKDEFNTDSKGAAGAETNEGPRISDVTTSLVAKRLYCANCLHPPEEPNQDIENGIRILHSTQIPYSQVGNGFKLDILQTFLKWKILQSKREQEQQNLPRIKREVRKRQRISCLSCELNTGRLGGHCVRCGKLAEVKGAWTETDSDQLSSFCYLVQTTLFNTSKQPTEEDLRVVSQRLHALEESTNFEADAIYNTRILSVLEGILDLAHVPQKGLQLKKRSFYLLEKLTGLRRHSGEGAARSKEQPAELEHGSG